MSDRRSRFGLLRGLALGQWVADAVDVHDKNTRNPARFGAKDVSDFEVGEGFHWAESG